MTGATGFLGSRLVERLCTLPGVARITAAGRSLKPYATIHDPRVQYRLGALEDRDYVASLFAQNPPTALVNCAALSSPWGRYQDFYDANVRSQAHLIAEAQRHDLRRFVYVSTPSLYFDYRHRHGIRESDPLPHRLVNAYAETKRQAEQLLEASDLSWVAIRPRALVGRGDTVIMPRLLRAHHEGRLRIIGTGHNRVDLTPVANVVDAIICGLQAPETACGSIYNIANGDPVSLWETIAQTLERLGLEPPRRRVPAAVAIAAAGVMEWYARTWQGGAEPTLTRYSVGTLACDFSMDIGQARAALGYVPRMTVAEAIDEFVSWWKEIDGSI
ncbi:MAG: NAD(P)-dependent oxidoreductase [Bacteroidia bacterium]